jgi:hypothetical protein
MHRRGRPRKGKMLNFHRAALFLTHSVVINSLFIRLYWIRTTPWVKKGKRKPFRQEPEKKQETDSSPP